MDKFNSSIKNSFKFYKSMNVNRNTRKILKPLLVIETLLTVVSPAYSGIYSLE